MIATGDGTTALANELVATYRRTGDAATREHVVRLLLPLVRRVARKYANRGEDVDDLVQVGCVGLIQAIDRFDPRRGDDVIRYAVPTIAGSMRHHLRDRVSVVRVPRAASERPPLTITQLDDAEPGTRVRSPEDADEKADTHVAIVAALRTLGERERRILLLRFFAGLSQDEIAHEVGLSQVQVSRLIRSSLERLRACLGTAGSRPPSARSRL